MTALDQVKQLLTKLESPYWTPMPTSKYLTNSRNYIAQFNMYYVLRGRPSQHHTGDITKYIDYWRLAGRIVSIISPKGPLSETILIASPEEIYEHVILQNTLLYSQFLPLSEWKRVLNETRQDSLPANVAPYRAKLAGKPNK